MDKARGWVPSASSGFGESPPTRKDASYQLQHATDYHKQGRLPEAEALYVGVLTAEPENFDALNRLGILKYQCGHLAEAHRLLRAAIARNPHSDRAFSNYATVLLAQKRFEEALENCDRALALKPNDPDTIYNRGHILLELKRYEDALACYDRALAIDPTDPEAMNARGKTLVLLNRTEEALGSYESALTFNRNDADTWYNYGGVLSVLNRFDDALASYQRALAIHPDHEAALAKLGATLLTLSRSNEALACHERILQNKPNDVEALVNRGIALLDLGRYEDSAASFGRALVVAPNDPVALFGQAQALLALGRMPAALSKFDQLLTIDPQHAGTLRKRGDILLQLQRFDEALADFDKVLASMPDDADAWYNSGNASAALMRFEDALGRYDRALDVDPNHVLSLNNRGNALRNLGRHAEALTSYDRALAIAPDQIDALRNRATVLAALRRHSEALTTYERILAIEPRHFPSRWALVMRSIPRIGLSKEELDHSRQAFASGLDDLARRLPDAIDVEKAVYQSVPFYLAYQEENNRTLFARYGELCARAAGQGRAQKQQRNRQLNSPLRVGIVSAHVRRHSVWDALLKGFMQHLDSRRIEIDIFHTGALTDAETAWAMSRSARFEQGRREPVETWVDRILSRQPDVLLYPEIGMDPAIVYLASQRLADLQVAMWGHPHTTGLPTIDVFISADALEPPDAEDHYSERLIRLPRLGCCIAPRQVDATAVDLDALGIKQDRPLLLSPGTPYKYAPQHDWVFPEIAKRLGRCTIAFFEDKSAPWSDLHGRLLDRLAIAFAERGSSFSDTCVVLPWQERAAYYEVMKRADVMLDTIGFSGFNTAMQAMECGLPIVTRQGRFMRGRLASGILRSIGLEELIALDEDHYVDLVVAIASDKDHRDAIRRCIEQRRDCLFNDAEAAHACQERILRLAKK